MDPSSIRGQLSFPSIEGTLVTLRELGLEPRTCIDVGAYHGTWAKLFNSIFPKCNILMLEAQDQKRQKLQEAEEFIGPHACFDIALLGSKDDEEVTFCQMETGSSVYEESSSYDRHHIKKRTVRLDTLLEDHQQFKDADFLKIDTQGYELEILRGAPELIKHVEAVLLEASLLPVNEGCPEFVDIVRYMDEQQFNLFDLLDQTRRKDGVLWQADLLFLSRDSEVLPRPHLDEENWGGITEPEAGRDSRDVLHEPVSRAVTRGPLVDLPPPLDDPPKRKVLGKHSVKCVFARAFTCLAEPQCQRAGKTAHFWGLRSLRGFFICLPDLPTSSCRLGGRTTAGSNTEQEVRT